ncbi:acyl carrier protein [Streptomyces sp. NPDC049954]|uniref:acyl carrier protein n=1 Tax=Streptomyces sp. NPDC049954 TaxID=3155779 RepID=UPI00341496BA
MTNDQEQRTIAVSAEEIEDILIRSAGVADGTFDGNRGVSLDALGVDSLAVLELEAVLADRHGVEISSEAPRMSVNEIVESVRTTAGTVG